MKKHKSGISRPLFLILLLLVMCAPAAAQYADRLGGNWSNPASAMITNIIMDRYARKRLEKSFADKRANAGRNATASGPSVTTEAAPRINDAAVLFRSTGTQLKTREIANLISPGDAQVFTLLTTLLQEFDKETRKLGKPNDLTMALSFFLATNASIYHDAGVPGDPQMLELRDTIARALVEGNGLNGVTDLKKQELYEALVLYTGLALASYEEGKQGNAESLKTAQQLAGMNLLAVTGISPDKINFSEQGLSIETESQVADNSGAAQAETAAPPSSDAGAIDYKEMMREFDTNEIAADANYKGKRVRVVGPFATAEKVSNVELQYGKILVWFWHTGYYVHLGCFFDDSQTASVAQLRDRQTIVLEGTMLGVISPGRLMMNRCVIKSVGPRKEE